MDLPFQILNDSSPLVPSHRRPLKVILIEDSSSDAKLFEHHLRRVERPEEYFVLHVKRLETGLKLLARDQFDVAIVDVSLPDAFGVESIRALRSTFPHLPLVMMSGCSDDEVVAELMREGAQDFLPKEGLTPERLTSSLRFAIARNASTQSEREASLHDPLTGLLNRRGFMSRLEHSISWASRDRSHLAVIYLDLDGFKPINDQFGHSVGDAVLLEVGHRLESLVRRSDSVARLGGDEFVLLLTDIRNPDSLSTFSRRLERLMTRPFQGDGHSIPLRASLGLSMFPMDGTQPKTLLEASDHAMYESKRHGEGRLVVASRSINSRIQLGMVLEDRLREAIGTSRIKAVFQPIFRLDSQTCIALEALVRWTDPEWGLIPTRDFLSLAGRSGLLRTLNEHLLRESLEALQSLTPFQPQLSLCVNISPYEFRSLSYHESVHVLLEETRMDPSRLRFECRETALLDPLDGKHDFLRQLARLGCRLSLDDYGSGPCSMKLLSEIPFDTLKVDPWLTRELRERGSAPKLLERILEMATSDHLQVIAEGIESPLEVPCLQRLGCQEGQGFFWGQPLSRGELEKKLRSGT